MYETVKWGEVSPVGIALARRRCAADHGLIGRRHR